MTVQRIKDFLVIQLGIPPFILLVALGSIAHLVLNALLRKAATSAWGLLGPLLLGLALESYEIWAQYRQIGLFAPGNDPVIIILGRHALDVLIMLAVPLLLVLWVAISAR